MREWPAAALGDLCDIQIGKTPTRSEGRFWGDGYPWLSIADMGQGRILSTTSEAVTQAAVDELNLRLVDPGTLLLSFKLSIGKVGITDAPMYTNEAIAHLPIVNGRIERDYLYWALRTVPLARSADRAAMGATLNKAKLRQIPIPLPPIEEQRRIATVLDVADALRARRRQALAKLDTLTQSIFIDMFGDPRSGQGRLEHVPVGELATNEDSKRIPVKLADRDGKEGEYPYYGASGIIDHVDDYLFDGRRLLVAEDGANLLARSSPVTFLADGKYWVNNHAHVLADNGRANLVYLRQAIESLDLSPFVTGSAQPKLNRGKLDSILIPTPNRALQDEFEWRVVEVHGLDDAERAHSAQLDNLFASVQQRAFRGEL